MTKFEKIEFITSLMDSMKREMIDRVDRMPDDWNGLELRRYITEKVKENSGTNHFNGMGRSRVLKYKNTVIINNL